jgi:hypothetical protein
MVGDRCNGDTRISNERVAVDSALKSLLRRPASDFGRRGLRPEGARHPRKLRRVLLAHLAARADLGSRHARCGTAPGRVMGVPHEAFHPRNWTPGYDGTHLPLVSRSRDRPVGARNRISGRPTHLPITEFEPGMSGNLSQLIGGTQDNGTVRYSGTPRWKQILGADGGYSASDSSSSQTVYASQQRFAFKRSTDGGATWTSISPTLPTGDQGLFYSPFTNEPGQPNTLYAGSQRLWRSTDRGSTWTAVGNSFGSTISAIGTGTTTPTATNATAYVGFSAGGARYSANVTATTPTWTPSVGLPNRWVTDFWVDPTNPQDAYAAVSGFGTGHLFHTTDGVNWVAASGNLPNTPVNAIAVDTSGAFPVIYAGTDVGVFASGDGGVTWANASTNLPPTVIVDLLIDPSQGALVTATHGRGAYTAQLSQAPPFAALTLPKAITEPVGGSLQRARPRDQQLQLHPPRSGHDNEPGGEFRMRGPHRWARGLCRRSGVLGTAPAREPSDSGTEIRGECQSR